MVSLGRPLTRQAFTRARAAPTQRVDAISALGRPEPGRAREAVSTRSSEHPARENPRLRVSCPWCLGCPPSTRFEFSRSTGMFPCGAGAWALRSQDHYRVPLPRPYREDLGPTSAMAAWSSARARSTLAPAGQALAVLRPASRNSSGSGSGRTGPARPSMAPRGPTLPLVQLVQSSGRGPSRSSRVVPRAIVGSP